MTLAPPDSRTKARPIEQIVYYLLPIAIVSVITYQVLVTVLDNYQSCSASPPCLAGGILLRLGGVLGEIIPFLVVVEVVLLLYLLVLRYLRGLKDPMEGDIRP